MSDGAPREAEPGNIFEMFPRSLGGLGLVASWGLFYAFVLTPWDGAKRHLEHVAHSSTALGVTTAVTLISAILAIAGLSGYRLLAGFAPAKFGWKQGLFVFVWAAGTVALHTLLQQHLRQQGYSA